MRPKESLVNQTPGRDNEMDAYRAEVCGIYGCLAFTNELLSQHQVSNGSITMACDCKSALLNIFDKAFDKPAQSHYDVIHACRLHLEKQFSTPHRISAPGRTEIVTL
jgi:hypothetical protein